MAKQELFSAILDLLRPHFDPRSFPFFKSPTQAQALAYRINLRHSLRQGQGLRLGQGLGPRRSASAVRSAWYAALSAVRA